jgi:hypothetical protein
MTTPTTTPESYRQFGQTLAFCERTLTKVLRGHLAKHQVTPETWYALKLIATQGPELDRQALSRDLEGSPTLDADSTRALLERLGSDGVIEGDALVSLTATGQDLFASLSEYVSLPTRELLGQFDLRDIDTTVRTLHAITERAAAELDEMSA